MPDNIFDKVKTNVIDCANAITDMGEQLVETAKLRASRAKLESELNDSYVALGKTLYEMIEKNEIKYEDLKTRCTVITHLKAMIADNLADEEYVKSKQEQTK